MASYKDYTSYLATVDKYARSEVSYVRAPDGIECLGCLVTPGDKRPLTPRMQAIAVEAFRTGAESLAIDVQAVMAVADFASRL